MMNELDIVLADAKESIHIVETFLTRVGAVHRLDPSWPPYDEFSVKMQVFHGTRPVVEPLYTSYQAKATEGLFYERVAFDSWLEAKTLNICSLPREARVVFTLNGRSRTKVVVNNPDKDNNRKSSEYVYESMELGWTALQLFNYDM